MTVGVPIKLLHEAMGHTVSLELKTGVTYRGTLLEAEDNMNLQLRNMSVTSRDGKTTVLEQVFIRGSQIRFIVIPDMLKNAPMFRKVVNRGKGTGLGKGRGNVARPPMARGIGGIGRGGIVPMAAGRGGRV